MHEFDANEVDLWHLEWESDSGVVDTKSLFWTCTECGARNMVTPEHKDYKRLRS